MPRPVTSKFLVGQGISDRKGIAKLFFNQEYAKLVPCMSIGQLLRATVSGNSFPEVTSSPVRKYSPKILRLSLDLPIVIEIVDTEEKINAFLPTIDPMIQGGMVTLEKVRVLNYRAGQESIDVTG